MLHFVGKPSVLHSFVKHLAFKYALKDIIAFGILPRFRVNLLNGPLTVSVSRGLVIWLASCYHISHTVIRPYQCTSVHHRFVCWTSSKEPFYS